jgi:hypothetical protein
MLRTALDINTTCTLPHKQSSLAGKECWSTSCGMKQERAQAGQQSQTLASACKLEAYYKFAWQEQFAASSIVQSCARGKRAGQELDFASCDGHVRFEYLWQIDICPRDYCSSKNKLICAHKML